jgi:hypothetical protein
MSELDPRQKAERIVELFRSRRPTEILPAEVYPASLDEAYAIRRAYQEIEEATGRGAIAGYKIGLTTPVMQKLCGVDEPCYGAIFTREVHHRRAALSARDYCRLGVETEIAFRLGDDLSEAAIASRSPPRWRAAAASAAPGLRHDYKGSRGHGGGQRMECGVVPDTLTEWRALDLNASGRGSRSTAKIGSNWRRCNGQPAERASARRQVARGTPLRRE